MKRTLRLSSWVVCGMLMLLWTSPAVAITLHPTDDTNINLNRVNQVNGTHAQVFVRNVGGGGERQGFVKFDLSPIPTGLQPTIVKKVILRLFVNRLQNAGAIDIHDVLGPWNEETLSANSPPPAHIANEL